LGWAISGAGLAFFFVDFQELESSKAMGASEIELFFNLIIHLHFLLK